MDNCYFHLAQAAYDRKEYDITLAYYDMIVDNLIDSELIPQILHNRIQLYMDIKGDDETAWDNYVLLNQHYPENEYIALSQPFIDRFMNRYIDEAVDLQYSDGYRQALEQLFLPGPVPLVLQGSHLPRTERTLLETCGRARHRRRIRPGGRNLSVCDRVRSHQRRYGEQPAQDICTNFMEEGDKLIEQRHADQAIIMYARCFNIIKDYEPAALAISEANILKQNIEQANRLSVQALEEEKQEKWATALQLYRDAYRLDALSAYKDKIFLMTNMIEIEKDPIAFARRIMNEYRNGRIIRRVSQLEQELIMQYKDQVSSSGWRYVLSVGEAKYEVRYDISTPDKSYFLVWLVNLKDRTVSPLNKASEELLE